MTVADAVNKRVRALLAEKGMSLYKLELDSNILHGTMMGIMRGKNKNVTLRILMQIAKGFKMKLIEFLDDPIFEDPRIELE